MRKHIPIPHLLPSWNGEAQGLPLNKSGFQATPLETTPVKRVRTLLKGHFYQCRSMNSYEQFLLFLKKDLQAEIPYVILYLLNPLSLPSQAPFPPLPRGVFQYSVLIGLFEETFIYSLNVNPRINPTGR